MSYYEALERPLNLNCCETIGYCRECGNDIFNGQEIYEIDENWYCEECVNEEHILPYIPRENAPIGYCEECSESLYNDQDVYKLDKNLYCEKCIKNLHTQAYERGNPFENI